MEIIQWITNISNQKTDLKTFKLYNLIVSIKVPI